MADSTLVAIQKKVRRLTRTPSENQLSDDDVNEYINTFIAYDFPEHLRTFNLRTTFTFYTNPGQDVYPTDEASFFGVTTNVLYNFQNLYLTVHPPCYIAGYQSLFTQSPSQFYNIYPKISSISSIGLAGDGVTATFTGVINSQQALIPAGFNQQITLLQNDVFFSSVDSNGNGLMLYDIPVMNPATGNPTINGNLYVPSSDTPLPTSIIDSSNTINYSTGVFTITFPVAPGAGVAINSQTVPLVANLPQSVLYYANQFTVRPIPDQPYPINIEVYKQPTQLLVENQSPDLEEYWQYIAYGAAKKVFEDRMDLDSVALILPEYKKQEALCLRRNIVQYTNERTATIYAEQTGGYNQTGQWWGSGNF